MGKLLGFFDKVFLINLDKRPDRLQRVTKRCSIAGIPFERVAGVIPPDIGRYHRLGAHGLALTHISILQAMVAADWEYVLILEDDCLFRRDFQVQWRMLMSEVEQLPESWELLYLGGLVKQHHVLGNLTDHWISCANIIGTHAVVVRRASVSKLLSELNTNYLPIDLLYGCRGKFSVAFSKPVLSLPEYGWSDIEDRQTVPPAIEYVDYQAFMENKEE